VVNYLLISGEAGQVGKNLVMPVEASLSMLLQAENNRNKPPSRRQHCTYTCRLAWIGWAQWLNK